MKYDTVGRELLRKVALRHEWAIDVGCRDKLIAQNCVGVDIDKTAKAASLRIDLQAMAAHGITDVPCIVAAHCLEHCKVARHAIGSAYMSLRTGGTFAVIVPHGEDVDSNTLGDGDRNHYQLFTPKTLELYFMFAGFDIVKCCAYNRPYAWRASRGIYCEGVK